MKFKARKSQNQEEKIISRLKKKLKIKKGEKLPGVFYSEGYGDLIDICDEIINKKHIQEDCSDNESLFDDIKSSQKIVHNLPVADENLTDKEFLKIFESHKDEKIIRNHQFSSLPNHAESQILTTKGDINDECLKKSIKILLNKLSDRNMIKLLEEFKIILSQHGMNNTYAEFVKAFMECVVKPSSLADRFSLIYTTFLSIVHFVTGNEIMAIFLNNLMKKYCEYFEELNIGEITKHCQNIVSVVCILYDFNNIGYVLISDLIKKLLERFREQDIEMILQILKYCGFDLRKREPVVLKAIIIDVHNRCKNAEKISLYLFFYLHFNLYLNETKY
ncbi:hypothetical protein MXB_2078 [Myxobolus squamalis]|nr:hypothetical protein MXB_2078 [Myxobolus squamalis]